MAAVKSVTSSGMTSSGLAQPAQLPPFGEDRHFAIFRELYNNINFDRIKHRVCLGKSNETCSFALFLHIMRVHGLTLLRLAKCNCQSREFNDPPTLFRYWDTTFFARITDVKNEMLMAINSATVAFYSPRKFLIIQPYSKDWHEYFARLLSRKICRSIIIKDGIATLGPANVMSLSESEEMRKQFPPGPTLGRPFGEAFRSNVFQDVKLDVTHILDDAVVPSRGAKKRHAEDELERPDEECKEDDLEMKRDRAPAEKPFSSSSSSSPHSSASAAAPMTDDDP